MRRWGAAVTLAVVALAPLTPAREPVQRRDRALLTAVVTRRSPGWVGPALRLTALAEPAVVLPVCAAAATAAHRRGVPPARSTRVLAGAAAGIAGRRLLAGAVRRQRPPSSWWWHTPSGYSYPSRHVTWAVLGYGAAADLLHLSGPADFLMRTGPTTAVAATRLVLAVHWPSDITAALAFAVAWRTLIRPASGEAGQP